jgi:hypothetical protein
MIRRQDLVSSHGKVGIFTEVATRTMKDMGMVKCTGLMALAIRANGKMVFKTELVAWNSPMGVSKKENSRKTFSKAHV